MNTIQGPWKAGWIIVAVVVSVGIVAALWVSPWAHGQLGGHSQVTRLELRYTPGEGRLDARFHLASGLAVTHEIDDSHEIDRLLQAAEIFAGGKSRMSVSVQSDQVRSWHLSVP